jgi:hypothetical protein
MTASAVTVPPAVAKADAEVLACEERFDALADYLASLRKQLDFLREAVEMAEAQKQSALLHLDTARHNAGLALKDAGLLRTATGFIPKAGA